MSPWLMQRARPIDWRRVILDIIDAGISLSAAAAAINVPRSTMRSWRDEGATPNYEDGRALLVLWGRRNSVTQAHPNGVQPAQAAQSVPEPTR